MNKTGKSLSVLEEWLKNKTEDETKGEEKQLQFIWASRGLRALSGETKDKTKLKDLITTIYEKWIIRRRIKVPTETLLEIITVLLTHSNNNTENLAVFEKHLEIFKKIEEIVEDRLWTQFQFETNRDIKIINEEDGLETNGSLVTCYRPHYNPCENGNQIPTKQLLEHAAVRLEQLEQKESEKSKVSEET